MAYATVRPISISAAWATASLSDVDFLFKGTYSIYKSVALGGFVQSAFGYDIGFFEDAACTQPLDWEIERWNPTTGEIVAWMRLPAVVLATQTVVYAAIGDAAIVASLENPPGIWFDDGFGSGFRGVWHLPTTANKYLDSTRFGHTMTPTAAPPSITGQIDGAISLDGATQYTAADGTFLQVTGHIYMSMWFYPLAFGTAGGLIMRHVNFMNYYMGLDATGHLVGGANVRDFPAAVSGAPLTLFAWNYLQAGYEGDPPSNPQPNFVVLNTVRTNAGVPYDSGGYTGSGPTWFGTSAGFPVDPNPPVLPGYMDEVRILTTPMTQPRIVMQYANQNGIVFDFEGGLPGQAGCVVTL